MLFGLRNTGQTFQRLIYQNFHDLPFCFPFADDNLVGSADRSLYLEHLRQVFQIMEKWGLTLNIANCEFGQPTVTFLGHQVSTGGISPLAAKVAAITSLHRPSTIKELLRYLDTTAVS